MMSALPPMAGFEPAVTWISRSAGGVHQGHLEFPFFSGDCQPPFSSVERCDFSGCEVVNSIHLLLIQRPVAKEVTNAQFLMFFDHAGNFVECLADGTA